MPKTRWEIKDVPLQRLEPVVHRTLSFRRLPPPSSAHPTPPTLPPFQTVFGFDKCSPLNLAHSLFFRVPGINTRSASTERYMTDQVSSRHAFRRVPYFSFRVIRAPPLVPDEFYRTDQLVGVVPESLETYSPWAPAPYIRPRRPPPQNYPRPSDGPRPCGPTAALLFLVYPLSRCGRERAPTSTDWE